MTTNPASAPHAARFRPGLTALPVALLLSLIATSPVAVEAQDGEPWITFQGSVYHAFAMHDDENNWERTIRTTGIRAEAGVFELLSPWVGITRGSSDPSECWDDEDVLGAEGGCPPGDGEGWMVQGGMNVRLFTRPLNPNRVVRLVPFVGIGAGMSLNTHEEAGRETGVVFQIGADLNMTPRFAVRGAFMADRVFWPHSTPLLALGLRYGAL